MFTKEEIEGFKAGDVAIYVTGATQDKVEEMILKEMPNEVYLDWPMDDGFLQTMLGKKIEYAVVYVNDEGDVNFALGIAGSGTHATKIITSEDSDSIKQHVMYLNRILKGEVKIRLKDNAKALLEEHDADLFWVPEMDAMIGEDLVVREYETITHHDGVYRVMGFDRCGIPTSIVEAVQ